MAHFVPNNLKSRKEEILFNSWKQIMRFARTTFAKIYVSVSFVSEVTRQYAFLKCSKWLIGLILMISLRKKPTRIANSRSKTKSKKTTSLNCTFSLLLVELANFPASLAHNKKEAESEYNLCELNFLNSSRPVTV